VKSLWSESQQRVVVPRVEMATTFFSRFKGLLGRSGMEPGEGLFLLGVPSIHMYLMRFPIDVFFFDGDMRVARICHSLQPWSTACSPGAYHTLELMSGQARALSITEGELMRLVPEGYAP